MELGLLLNNMITPPPPTGFKLNTPGSPIPPPPAGFTLNTPATPPAPKLGIEDSLRAKGGYGNEMVASEVAGAKKVYGSLQKGGQEMYAGMHDPSIAGAGKTLTGAFDAAVGTVSGLGQIVTAPIAPAVDRVVKFLTPGFKANNPEVVKAFDYIMPKVNEMAQSHPEAATRISDTLDTLLWMVGGGAAEQSLKAPVKEAFTKEAVQGLKEGVVKDVIPAVTQTGGKVVGNIKNAATTIKDVATSGSQLKTAESGLQDLNFGKENLKAQQDALNSKTVAGDLKSRVSEIPTAGKTISFRIYLNFKSKSSSMVAVEFFSNLYLYFLISLGVKKTPKRNAV